MADDVWALVREDAGAGPHRDGEDQVGRLPAVDPQPNLGGAGRRVAGRAAARRASTWCGSVFPPAKGIRLVGVTLSNFQSARQEPVTQLDLALGLLAS